VIQQIQQAALAVLHHNFQGTLPRTAGWGYPEPYTRDLMLSAFGILASGDAELIESLRRVLESLALNQSERGLIPGLADNPADRGSSDTTPLFLIGLALFRQVTGESHFLASTAQKALVWMAYQSPEDRELVAQQPTSDWRDEQWVLGYGLFVNVLVYIYQRLWGLHEQADRLRARINLPVIVDENKPPQRQEGFVLPDKPYYALWSYKVHYSPRFDLLGNCLAILSGVMLHEQANRLIDWLESECTALRKAGLLALDLPPCLLPYIQPGDPDWHPRYELFNQPGEYHNGGVWPFIAGFYVAALIAIGRHDLAQKKLAALADLVRPARRSGLDFGFNEWLRAQDGMPHGEDWQTWSAALFLYASAVVQQGRTP
jgi:hypothetical protein